MDFVSFVNILEIGPKPTAAIWKQYNLFLYLNLKIFMCVFFPIGTEEHASRRLIDAKKRSFVWGSFLECGLSPELLSAWYLPVSFCNFLERPPCSQGPVAPFFRSF